MDYFWSFSWVLIPLFAILVGGFKEWLKFKAKTRELGASTRDLEQTVAAQQQALGAAQAQQDALVRRIQNLEAIVTGQLWDVLHDDALPPAEKQRALTAARLELDEPDEPSDADRVAQIARRINA